MTPRIGATERRARLVARHGLGVPAATVGDATDAIIALHATDPVTVYLSAWARARDAAVADVDQALYTDRSLVRMLGMRRTMFVVPASLAPVIQRACTDDVAKRLRSGLERDLAKGGIGESDPGGWLRDVGEGALRALAKRGRASAAELSADEPRLRTQLTYAPGKSYGGVGNITSRVLMLLSAEGHIVRGHRRGGWASGQFQWFPMEAWLPGLGDFPEPAAARVDVARRWLLSFGPAPVSDLQWWSGWTGAQVKAALAKLPVAEVDLDGVAGVALASDLDPAAATDAPCAALLPGLDPTPMGWQSREWFLGPHGQALFDRTGNIGPTVWWDGRIVGGWAQRASGEVACQLLEDIGADGVAAVSAETARLQSWLGEARVTPRFRTPLERELSA